MNKKDRKIINVYARLESEALSVLSNKRYNHLEVEERLDLYASRRERTKFIEEQNPHLSLQFSHLREHYELEGNTLAHKLIDKSLNAALHRHGR